MTLEGRMLGRYELEALLGQGGMAEVYRARDTKLARSVAVKVIHALHARDPQFLGRFLTEARVVARLEHPGVLPVYDFGEEGGVPFLVMPYLEGGTLRERLVGQPIPVALAVAWVSQLAEALDFAHAAGVLHRDVKPANVLLGRGERIALADFGIAKMLESTTGLTSTGMVIGTPVYMAPEQAQGKPASPASDRYALAVLAYEILTGAPPFDGESALALMHQHVTTPAPLPSSRVPGLSRDLDPVFSTALAKRPEERHPSCRAFAVALAGAVGAEISSPTVAWSPPAGTEILTPPTALRRPALDTREETLPTTARPEVARGAGPPTPTDGPSGTLPRVPAWLWGGALASAVVAVAAWVLLGGRAAPTATDRGPGGAAVPTPTAIGPAAPEPAPESLAVTVVEVTPAAAALATPAPGSPVPDRRVELLRSFESALAARRFDPADARSAIALRKEIASELPGTEATRASERLFQALRDDAIRRNARGDGAGAAALVAEMEILRPSDPEVARLKGEMPGAAPASLSVALPVPPAPPVPAVASSSPGVAAAWGLLETAPRTTGRLSRSSFDSALRLASAAPAEDAGRAEVERYCRGGLAYLAEPPRTSEAWAALKDVSGLDGRPLVAAWLEQMPAARPEERDAQKKLILAVGYRDARGSADREFEEALAQGTREFVVRMLRAHLRRAQSRRQEALADTEVSFRKAPPMLKPTIAVFGVEECDALGRNDSLCEELRGAARIGPQLGPPPGRRPPRGRPPRPPEGGPG